MMSKVHHYTSMVVFFLALMAGIQGPNFVDQYVKRVDAHYQEVLGNAKKFVEVANRYHNGSMESLIDSHKTNADPAFRAEAEPIKVLYERRVHFEAEKQALQGPLWSQALHIIQAKDEELLRETYANYTANVPLNTDAALSGVLAGIVASIMLEIILSFFRLFSRGKKQAPIRY